MELGGPPRSGTNLTPTRPGKPARPTTSTSSAQEAARSVITLSNGTPSRRSDALSHPMRALCPPASTAAVSMEKS